MQKTIVTHVSPDLDGIPAIWLLRKFHPDFKTAKVALVPAGDNTLNNQPVDSDPDVLHVDVGGGKFDHHHTNDFTCGAKLVYEWLVKEGFIDHGDKTIERMIQIITEIDHGWDSYKWPDCASDRWEFSLHQILSGLKMVYPKQDEKHIEFTSDALEAIYRIMQSKIKAEEEVENGLKFKTSWGKGVAVYTKNDGVMDAAIKNGYAVVLRKDPAQGYVRITGSNSHKVDFTKAYELIAKKDDIANWFLHASKVLLRNGSTRNPNMKPTTMSIEEVVEILEKA
jgi:hypothetical protein